MCSEHCCKRSQALCVCSLRLSAAQEVASVTSCVVRFSPLVLCPHVYHPALVNLPLCVSFHLPVPLS